MKPMRTRIFSLVLMAAVSWLCVGVRAEEPGVLFWNGNPAGPHLDIVGDDAGTELLPVKIVATRNGTFSGKVVVCSTAVLKDVSATMTDLAATDGKGRIPLSRVQVRLATGWLKSGWQVQSKAGSTFDILNEDARIDPVDPIGRPGKYHPWVKAGRSCLPVWVTVGVPADASTGEYAGTLTLRAGGVVKAVPVKLTVHAWVLPDPKDFRTWVETIQSPDTLALEYNVPLWSESHWRLIEQSLRYGAMLGSRTVYFPLICETNFGNAQSAVRWVKEGANRYRYDFSIVEKYLDLQTKVQGKPRIVCFPVWDTFLEGGQFAGDIKYEPAEARDERLAYRGRGPEVTLLESADGDAAKLQLPQFSDPASAALWSPLIRQIPGILRKRGLEDTLFFGMANDDVPPTSCLELVNANIPGAKWVIHAHSFYGGKDKKANFQYAAFVWGVEGFCTGSQGWKKPFLLTQFMRNMDNHFPITSYRLAAEVNITGGQRGLGRIGLDYWRVVKNSRGQRVGRVWERYPKANWRNLNITDSLLAPGREGPLATARFEMMREGVQECEARIFIQTALDGGKVTGPLAEQCRKVLSERDTFLRESAISREGKRPWFDYASPGDEAYLLCAGTWQEQSDRLYRTAAEVSRKLGVR